MMRVLRYFETSYSERPNKSPNVHCVTEKSYWTFQHFLLSKEREYANWNGYSKFGASKDVIKREK